MKTLSKNDNRFKKFLQKKTFWIIFFLLIIAGVLSLLVFTKIEKKYGNYIPPAPPVSIPPAGFI